jgi:two-component system cell cycle sensor histidine kinase/response regulator CckA
MFSDPSAVPALVGGLIALAALAALGAVPLAFGRHPRNETRRGVALLLGALGLAGASHAIAPIGPVAVAAAEVLAAVLACCGVVVLVRSAPPPSDVRHVPDTPNTPDVAEALNIANISNIPDTPDVPDAPPLLDVALAACGDGVVIATTDAADGLQIVYSNPAFEHLTGYTNEEAVGLSPSVLVDEVDSLTVVREALRGTEPVRVEVPGRRKDGTRVWAEWQVVPVTGADGRHTHSVAVLRDTTERRRAEHALRASEARFRALFEQAADGIFVLDAHGRIVDANRQACQTLGYDRAELLDRRLADLGEPSGASGQPLWETTTAESTFCRKDGGTIVAEIRCTTTESGGRRFTLAMVRDVTRRRRAEQALREREELLRNIIATIPCGVFWKDRDSVYLGCNEQVARDHGLASADQVVGCSDYEISCAPEEASFYRDCDREVMESGRPMVNVETAHTRRDGTRATLLMSKVPLRDGRGRVVGVLVVGVLGVYTDITERKRLEEQFRQAQKMEAVGRLAGGVAHDFNNLLTVIRGNADLLDPAALGAGEGALLDDLILAADRATALVRQLLMFSRRQPVRVEVLDLNGVITSLSALLRRLLGERVVLEPALATEGVVVRADRSHLEQVVMNLAVNARDAMPNGGTLTVRTEAVERATAKGSARFVRLTITDTGTGMTDEVKARIFEPFFTTKGQDQGTGLGLATVFGIVQQSGGHIDVDSAPGAGTTFRVDLPRWAGSASGSVMTPAPRAVPDRFAGRPVSVLLVEDQDAVRKFARLALLGQGHEVADAESGEAALELVSAGTRFDVLVTDVSMPGIDGHELAARIRASRPEVAVVLMSGYAPDADRIERLERAVFLQKPFPPADLLAALNRALRLVRRDRTLLPEHPLTETPVNQVG